MDIDQHVNQIVQNIVREITSKVEQQAMSAIENKITEVISGIDYNSIIGEKLNQKIEERLGRLPIDVKSVQTELTNRIDVMATTLANTVKEQSLNLVKENINNQVKKIDFHELCQATLVSAIRTDKLKFDDGVIPGSAINTDSLRISGSNISGGIIPAFSSTGIDDKATDCRLTIFDDITVVENNLLTKDLTVKGTATIEGDLIVTGTVPPTSALYVNLVNSVTENVRLGLDHSVFDSYADLLFTRIKENGLDLNKITLNGTDIVNGGNLSNNITFSNLQRLGVLHELSVSGEAFLSQSLYTTNKRVGINTIEPTQALSIWDQEVEIGFGKKEDGVAIIGTPRNHSLIVGSNGKNNLTLLPDGSVLAHKVSVGSVSLSSSSTPPNSDAPAGSIVFNANPTLGGPLGWVSLGGARWANFGFID